ncbi:MAG TPA: hypothetical protein VF147_18790 [Vicinamibacterales bacterium]
MRLIKGAILAAALLVPATAMAQMDGDRKVPGGGITAPGWKGTIDASSAKAGGTINDSKFAKEGDALKLTIGPAATYWNPANTASGTYTIKATFAETNMGVASGHPHPYGLFIGGNNLDTPEKQTYLYCTTYGDGAYLVRGFNGATPFTVTRKTPNPAVKSTTKGGEVTNEIAWNVTPDKAECVVNGTVVATLNKADIVTAGKLDSLDGVYGIRVSHNLDVVVTGLSKK